MYRYLQGVQPPKRKQTAEENKAYDREYESKHYKRLFQSEWKANRPWFRAEIKEDDKELMFCDFCVKTGKESENNAFVKGCSNLKLYSIKKHEINSCQSLCNQ